MSSVGKLNFESSLIDFASTESPLWLEDMMELMFVCVVLIEFPPDEIPDDAWLPKQKQ